MTLCRNGCGKELTWDKTRKNSDGTKMIPIEKATNEPHNCPKNPYNQKEGGTVETVQVQHTISGDSPPLSLAERIGVLEAAVASIQAKLNQLSPQV